MKFYQYITLSLCSAFLLVSSCKKREESLNSRQMDESARKYGYTYYSDLDITKENSFSFSSIQELDSFLNSTSNEFYLKEPAVLMVDKPLPNKDDKDVNGNLILIGGAGGRINIGGINFGFHFDGSDISNAWSSAYGPTFAYSWNQNAWTSDQNSNGTYTLNLYGTLNYNFFVEGIGTVWSSAKEYHIIYNPKTGKISLPVSSM